MSHLTKINILVIEDNDDDFFFIENGLDDEKYVLKRIINGTEGLNYLLNPTTKPDIVLLDYNLPGNNGITILEQLGDKTKDYGIIFLTFDDSVEVVVKAMRAGAIDFFVKTSLIKDELAEKIETVYERYKSLLKHRELQANFQSLIEAGTDAIWSIDTNYNIIVLNTAFKDLYKLVFNYELFSGANILEITPNPLKHNLKKHFDTALLGRKVIFYFDKRIGTKTYYYEIRLNPIVIENKITGVSAIGRDISKQKSDELRLKEQNEEYGILNKKLKRTNIELLRAHEKLRNAEESFANLFNKSRDGYVVNKGTGEIVNPNPAFAEMLGYTLDEIQDLNWHKITTEKWLNIKLNKFVPQLMQRGYTDLFEKEYIRYDGTILQTQVQSFLLNKAKVYKHALIGTFIRDITEQKKIELAKRKAELALAESEHYFRTIIEQSPIGKQIFNLKGLLIDANLSWRKLWKFNGEVNPVNSYNILNDKQLVELGMGNYFGRVFSGEIGDNQELEYDPKLTGWPGEIKFIKIRAYPLKNADDTFDRVVVLNEDISEHIKMVAQLSEQKILFETMFNAISDAIVMTNTKREITHVNASFPRIMGFLHNEVIGQTTDVFSSNSKSYKKITGKDSTENINSDGSIYEVDYKRKDGSIFTSETFGTKLYDENGHWIGMLGVIRDITQRKEQEKQIIKLTMAVEQSANSIVITDINGDIEYTNPKFSDITGYSSDEVLGKNPRFLKSDVQNKEFYEEMWKTIASGNTWNGEFCNKNKNGYLFWEHVTITPIKNNEGKIINYLGIKEDITDRKLAQIALKESQEKTILLYNSINDMAFLINKDGIIITCNELFARSVGAKSSDLIGNSVQNYLPPEFTEKWESILKQLMLVQAPVRDEISYHNRHFDYSIQPIFDTKKRMVEIAIFIRDITDRIEAQKATLNAAMQAEEKERLRISRDIHDSISPMLSAIKIYTQSLQKYKDMESVEMVYAQLNSIVNETIDGLAAISNNLSPHILQNFGLYVAIDNFIKRISNHNNIKFSVICNTKVRFDKNIEIALFRITTELINNSLKYSAASKIKITLHAGDNVQYQFVENGKGFNYNEIIDQSKGMGLKNIMARVQSNGGTIMFDSSNGVKVDIVMPLNNTVNPNAE